MAKSNISMSVIKRLPRYYRFLGELKKNGINRISSRELSIKMGLTASQIRQDFNCFGGFGQQGYGYNVNQLHIEIGNILGLNSGFKTILIGAGNLGRAIATHMSFDQRGFSLIGIFDKNEAMVGQMVKGLPIRHINGVDDFCREYHPTVAVLCIPSEQAVQVEKQLVDLGIKGFWNFTHSDIASKFPGVVVENVHLSDSLMTLCYQVSTKRKQRITHGYTQKEGILRYPLLLCDFICVRLCRNRSYRSLCPKALSKHRTRYIPHCRQHLLPQSNKQPSCHRRQHS